MFNLSLPNCFVDDQQILSCRAPLSDKFLETCIDEQRKEVGSVDSNILK